MLTVPAVTSKRRIAADLALLLVACFWGATFPMAKVILRHLPPFAYLAMRFGLAALLLLPLAVWVRSEAGPRARLRWPLAAGAALAGGFLLQTLGLRTAGATISAFITGLYVVLVPLLGTLWGRRPHRSEWIGVAAAVAGLALLTLRGPVRPGVGEILMLGCAFCFAWHILIMDRASGAMPPARLGVMQTAVVAVASALLIPTEPLPGRIPGPVVLAVAAMAVFGSAAAFTIQAWAQRFTSPTRVGLIFASEPASAAFFAAIWLGERLSSSQWIGSALILAGIVAIELPAGLTSRSTPSSRSRTP